MVRSIFFCVGAVGVTNGHFGQGSGPVFLDDVQCRGFEYKLMACLHRGIEVGGCNHHNDAGVVCMEGEW